MAATRLSYLAVNREATEDVAVTPTHFIRLKDGDINFVLDNIANNPIQNNRWNAMNLVPGKETTDGAYNIDLDPNECVHFMSACLGSLVSTDISSATDASVYRHRMEMANSLPTLSIEHGKGNLTDTSNNLQNYEVMRGFGVKIDSLVLGASDGILNMAVNLKAAGVFQRSRLIADAAAGASVDLSLETVEGLTTNDTVNIFDETPQNETDAIVSISTVNKTIQIATLGGSYTIANVAKVELVPLTPSYSLDARVFSFRYVSFQFGADLTAAASAVEEPIENWEFNYQNQLEERFGSLRPTPSKIAPKGASATLTYQKYYENVTDRDRYLNQTKKALIITITDDVIISATDTNDAKYTVKIELSDLRWTERNLPTGTDELDADELTAEAFYDGSDGRAIRIDVTNGLIGTTYTA